MSVNIVIANQSADWCGNPLSMMLWHHYNMIFFAFMYLSSSEKIQPQYFCI